MSDETKDPNTMTVAEAYRMQHQLGQSITWGNSNLNALQVKKLTSVLSQKYDYIIVRVSGRWSQRLLSTRRVLIFGCSFQ